MTVSYEREVSGSWCVEIMKGMFLGPGEWGAMKWRSTCNDVLLQ